MVLLLPSDPLDARNVMIEVRAGTGGEEAGIWVGDRVKLADSDIVSDPKEYQKLAQSVVELDELADALILNPDA
ncbi:hypothetical protein VNO80_28260 [Phaseolus coccineus]|uniref:Peptide chain release factor domain-containing protein n=1 Tax=Phaseolus coccineus TaxID=3886 RepID=A0AAN9LI17_PHACN